MFCKIYIRLVNPAPGPVFVEYPTYQFTHDFTKQFFEPHGFRDLGEDGMDEPVEWASEKSNLSVMLGYNKVAHLEAGANRLRPTSIYLGLGQPGGEIKEVDQSYFSPRILVLQPELAANYLIGLERRLREATVPEGMNPMRLSFESARWGSNKLLVVEYKVTIQPTP